MPTPQPSAVARPGGLPSPEEDGDIRGPPASHSPFWQLGGLRVWDFGFWRGLWRSAFPHVERANSQTLSPISSISPLNHINPTYKNPQPFKSQARSKGRLFQQRQRGLCRLRARPRGACIPSSSGQLVIPPRYSATSECLAYTKLLVHKG